MADEPESSATTNAQAPTSLCEAGVKYFCSNVTGDTCKSIIEWILEENLKKRHKRLTLIISSFGGEVYSSFALISAMRGSVIPVDTVGLGYIASAGLCIFIHGVKRVVTSDTYILSHQFSSGRYGKQHELLSARKEEDWLKERFIDMFTKRSKLDRDQVEKILLGPSDTFLTATEALEYGLADEIRL